LKIVFQKKDGEYTKKTLKVTITLSGFGFKLSDLKENKLIYTSL